MTSDPLRRFDRHQRRLGFTPVTIERRRAVVRAFMNWLHPVPLDDASARDIEAWLDTRPLSAQSRYTYIAYLTAFYDMDAGPNPARDIRRPKIPKRLPRPIRAADLAVALQAADLRMRCWLTLAAFQGFRCIEIANLRRESIIDSDDPPCLMVRQGKGQKDAAMGLNILAERALRGYGLPRHGPLWRTSLGTPMTNTLVSQYINRFLRDLGIEATAHNLRAFFGTSVYRLTKDPLVTKQAMRHASFMTTEPYIEVVVDAKQLNIVRYLGVEESGEQPTLF